MTSKLIENIEEDNWNKFVGMAKVKGMKVGELINELIFIFLEKEKIIKGRK